jgi:DHA1 family inner membrane transport protein
MLQAHDAPTLASAANIGAFNVGNAVGPWLAGRALAAGLGYTAPSWVGAAMVAAGLAMAAVAGRHERRSARSHREAASAHDYRPAVACLARGERCEVDAACGRPAPSTPVTR